MELSKYNVVYSDDSKVLIFNTLTSAVIKISQSEWNILNCGKLDQLSGNTINQLLGMGIVSDDTKSQLFQYKYKFFKSAFEAKKPFLYIAPTMNCNFECFYCFEKNNKHQGLMDEEIVQKIVKFLTVHNKKEIRIVWFGGEPMLGFGRIVYLCQQLTEAGISYSSSMITNGSLFTERNTSLLSLLNLKFIQFSMDGVGETHDKRRCFKGGHPSFSVVIKNLERILSFTDIPVVIQITMDHKNPTAYDEMKSYCKSHFSQYMIKGRLQVGYNNVQDRTGFDTIGTCFTADELVSDEITRMRSNDESCIKIPSFSNPCMYRASWYFAIDPQGNVYKCIEQLGNPSERIGSLKDDFISLKRLGLSAFQDDAFDDEECIACPVFPICGGGCPLDRIKRSKGERRDVCSKYKNGLSRMLPTIYERLKNQK